MAEHVAGGCACGAVRYAAVIDNRDAYLCHCRMCQRATGSVSIAFKNLPKANVTWLSPPNWYQSSPIARRPYCAKCGTSLGFEFIEGDFCDITVASLDVAAQFTPTHHFGSECLREEWIDTSALKRHKTSDYQPLVDRWIAATGKVPE